LKDNAVLSAAQAEQAAATDQDNLEKVQRRLRNLTHPDLKYYQDQLKMAQDALATAEENAQITSIGDLDKALQTARDALKTATDIYNDAQSAQARCANCERVFANAAGRMVKLEDAKKDFDKATDAVTVFELRLAQAQRGDTASLKDLRDNLKKAQDNLANVQNPKSTDVALAQADVDLAQAQLSDAQTRMAKLRVGPDPDLLAAAQARLATAQAALAAAQAALANTELRAPIAGAVADVTLKAGEQIGPGQGMVTLASLDQWVVKTDNLTEMEVVQVKQGRPAAVAFDALPGAVLSGTVTSIAQVYQESRGDIIYAVTLKLGPGDARMRWGMTAKVTFAP
jgi:multidrug resistance efflux pump